MPTVGSDEINIEAKILCFDAFCRRDRRYFARKKERRRGFPRRLDR
jgi:hypothetical protein